MDRFGAWKQRIDRLGTGPAEFLGHRSLIETDVAEAKGGEGVIAKLHCIVPGLLQQADVDLWLILHLSDLEQGLAQVAHRQRFIGLGSWLLFGRLTAAEHVEYEHREMTSDGPPAFAHQGGNRDVVGHAAFLHGCHHVVCIVLQGVVGGRRRCGSASVVIDSQATPHIQ